MWPPNSPKSCFAVDLHLPAGGKTPAGHAGDYCGPASADHSREKFMLFGTCLRPVRVAVLLTALTSSAFAESIEDKTAKAQADIPTCSKKIGTLAVYEPQNNWWQPLGLESPEALLKFFVMRSGCFRLVDRGKGMAA